MRRFYNTSGLKFVLAGVIRYFYASKYMKPFAKNNHKIVYLALLMLLMPVIVLIQNSCNKDECKIPAIDSLTFRNDSEKIFILVPSREFMLHGSNLKDANIYINRSRLDPLYVIDTDTSLLFYMPIMSSNSDENANTDSIRVIKSCGSDLMMVKILLAQPYIQRISNEYAVAGEEINLYGSNFSKLTTIMFPDSIEGTILPNYSDTSCQVIVPEGVTDQGELILTSESGVSYSSIGVVFHDRTGLICNFDDVDTWDGWGGQVIYSLADEDIPESNGYFYAGSDNNIAPGTDSDDNLTLPISNFSMPDFNGYLSADYFSLKFEIFAKFPWQKGSYRIELGKINNQDEIEFLYQYDFQPWNDTTYDGNFVIPQWETYQIPLSAFRLSTNSEITIQSYSQIRVANFMKWTFINPDEEGGGEMIYHFCVALDNFRIVQVKVEQ